MPGAVNLDIGGCPAEKKAAEEAFLSQGGTHVILPVPWQVIIEHSLINTLMFLKKIKRNRENDLHFFCIFLILGTTC